MVEILSAVAATHSEYRARQCGHGLPGLNKADIIGFAAGIILLSLVYAGLSLLASGHKVTMEQTVDAEETLSV